MTRIFDISQIELQPHELPIFDKSYGWYSVTRKGLVTTMFNDDRQMNPDIYDQALDVVKRVIATGMPPIGGWR